MRKSAFNVAFGGIVSALCLVLEFAVGILPVFLYVFPMICSILMYILYTECGLKTSLCAYVGVSVLSLFMCPDKEAAMMFVMFFGYYPILRVYIQKLKPKLLKTLLKFATFNMAMVLAYVIIIFVFGITETDMMGELSWFWILLLLAGNVVFAMFDVLLDRLLYIYEKKLRHRLFGHGKRR